MDENDDVKMACEKFIIPLSYPQFLFVLPAFYVAKADGTLSVKEAIAISFCGISVEIRDSLESKELQTFFNDWAGAVMNEVVDEKNSEDIRLVTRAIDQVLQDMGPMEALAKRAQMYEACLKVAQASGPLFSDHVSSDEQVMIQTLFGDIEKSEDK